MKHTLVLLCSLLHVALWAQPKFEQAYRTEFPIKVESRVNSADLSLIFAYNPRELAAVETQSGKKTWHINFQEKFEIRDLPYWEYYKANNVFVMYNKSNKKTPCTKFFVDGSTGNLLWKTTDFGDENEFGKGLIKTYDQQGVFVGIKDGVKGLYSLKTGAYMGEAPVIKIEKKMLYFGTITNGDISFVLTYEDKIRAAGNWTNSKSDIEVVATRLGTKQELWKTRIEANLVNQLCYNATRMGIWYNSYDEDIILNWEIKDRQLFLYYDGIAAIDLETGQLQWQTTFDRSDMSVSLRVLQTQDIASLPIITSDAVYVADLSKENNKIKKLNRYTGATIWETEQLKKDDIVPQMLLENNVLICKFGGIQVQHMYYDNVCNVSTVPRGNFGIKAFDATTGQLIWSTEKSKNEYTDKFDGMISNLISTPASVYAHGKKAIEIIDITSGKQVAATPFNELKIGTALGLSWYKKGEIYLVHATNGIAAINAQNGSIVWKTKLTGYYGDFQQGKYFYVWVGKSEKSISDFVAINLENGQIVGSQKDTRYPFFNADGTFFLKYDGQVFYKFLVP